MLGWVGGLVRPVERVVTSVIARGGERALALAGENQSQAAGRGSTA